MVLESFVADLINKYLGEFVENLDGSQLKISIMRGMFNNYMHKHTYIFIIRKGKKKNIHSSKDSLSQPLSGFKHPSLYNLSFVL